MSIKGPVEEENQAMQLILARSLLTRRLSVQKVCPKAIQSITQLAAIIKWRSVLHSTPHQPASCSWRPTYTHSPQRRQLSWHASVSLQIIWQKHLAQAKIVLQSQGSGMLPTLSASETHRRPAIEENLPGMCVWRTTATAEEMLHPNLVSYTKM